VLHFHDGSVPGGEAGLFDLPSCIRELLEDPSVAKVVFDGGAKEKMARKLWAVGFVGEVQDARPASSCGGLQERLKQAGLAVGKKLKCTFLDQWGVCCAMKWNHRHLDAWNALRLHQAYEGGVSTQTVPKAARRRKPEPAAATQPPPGLPPPEAPTEPARVTLPLWPSEQRLREATQTPQYSVSPQVLAVPPAVPPARTPAGPGPAGSSSSAAGPPVPGSGGRNPGGAGGGPNTALGGGGGIPGPGGVAAWLLGGPGAGTAPPLQQRQPPAVMGRPRAQLPQPQQPPRGPQLLPPPAVDLVRPREVQPSQPQDQQQQGNSVPCPRKRLEKLLRRLKPCEVTEADVAVRVWEQANMHRASVSFPGLDTAHMLSGKEFLGQAKPRKQAARRSAEEEALRQLEKALARKDFGFV